MHVSPQTRSMFVYSAAALTWHSCLCYTDCWIKKMTSLNSQLYIKLAYQSKSWCKKMHHLLKHLNCLVKKYIVMSFNSNNVANKCMLCVYVTVKNVVAFELRGYEVTSGCI